MEPLTNNEIEQSPETIEVTQAPSGYLNPDQVNPEKTLELVATKEDYKICRKIMRTASRNYSFASLFFPREKLPHVEALYALMRIGDDRVDVSHDGFKSSHHAIENWEDAYWNAFLTGDSPEPVIRAFMNTAYQFGIPPDLMSPYFRAMKDDLSISRFPTFNDLLYYMEGSALTVGRAMTYILGVRPKYKIKDALLGADSLSIAMQLSNFWRDIGHDWSIGRVYLPIEDLDHFNYSENDLAEQRINHNFIQLLEYEIERTEKYYQTAQGSLYMLNSGRWAVLSGLEIYRSILLGIRKNGYDVFTKRAGASTIQKIVISIRSYIKANSGSSGNNNPIV